MDKRIEFSYLHISYVRQIDQMPMTAILFKDNESFVEPKCLMINIYS